jgi:hypothetical protein
MSNPRIRIHSKDFLPQTFGEMRKSNSQEDSVNNSDTQGTTSNHITTDSNNPNTDATNSNVHDQSLNTSNAPANPVEVTNTNPTHSATLDVQSNVQTDGIVRENLNSTPADPLVVQTNTPSLHLQVIQLAASSASSNSLQNRTMIGSNPPAPIFEDINRIIANISSESEVNTIQMIRRYLKIFKVAELKFLLRKYNQSVNGLKAVLHSRLEYYYVTATDRSKVGKEIEEYYKRSRSYDYGICTTSSSVASIGSHKVLQHSLPGTQVNSLTTLDKPLNLEENLTYETVKVLDQKMFGGPTIGKSSTVTNFSLNFDPDTKSYLHQLDPITKKRKYQVVLTCVKAGPIGKIWPTEYPKYCNISINQSYVKVIND